MVSTAPHVPGSDTSKAAAKALTAKKLAKQEETILDLLRNAGPEGYTDDELDLITKMGHGSSTRARRMLVLKGLVKDSGGRRRSILAKSVTIWVPTGQEEVQEVHGGPTRKTKPSTRELSEALDKVYFLLEHTGFQPGPGLEKLCAWLANTIDKDS